MLPPWKVPTVDKTEYVLEQTAVRALTHKGLTVARLGTSWDRRPSSRAARRSVAATLPLAIAGLGVSDVFAKDAGVNTLVRVGWPDLRPAGQWIMVGQVTVGRGNDWEGKMGEPLHASEHWREIGRASCRERV